MDSEPRSEPFWKSPFVLGMGALFVGAVVANLVMVAFSVTGAPGLVSDDYYARGKSYTSRTLPKFLAPKGSAAVVAGLTDVVVGVAASVRVSGVAGAKAATLYAYRPADATADFAVALSPDGDGGFTGAVTFPLKGYWDVIAEPVGADGVSLPGIARRIRVGG